jgi:phosphohistidine phosphatase
VRRIYLLRHAKSSWDDPELEDHDRPLSRRGERAAALVAAHLRERGELPSLVLCSSSLRTRQTLAYLLVDALDGELEIRIEPGLYAAGAGSLLARVQAVPDIAPSVLVIAHNPGLQELALALAGGDERLARMPTGALATLEVPAERWSELRNGSAGLAGYVVPRELG